MHNLDWVMRDENGSTNFEHAAKNFGENAVPHCGGTPKKKSKDIEDFHSVKLPIK